MPLFDPLEIIGAFFGLLYLYLEYKASLWLWLAGVAMSLFYVAVYARAGFYATMAINIYYIAANIYGWWVWRKKRGEETGEDGRIRPLPRRLILPLAGIYLLLNLLFYFVLSSAGSAVPLEDSFITALSVIALWMMAKKYYHHWWLWLFVNIASVIIFFHNALIPTAILYIFYTLGSVMGYWNWKKMGAEK